MVGVVWNRNGIDAATEVSRHRQVADCILDGPFCGGSSRGSPLGRRGRVFWKSEYEETISVLRNGMTNRIGQEHGGDETVCVETSNFAGKQPPVVRGLEAGNVFQKDEVKRTTVAVQAQPN